MTLDLEDLYKDFHRHPELSFQEHRTAGIVADRLRDLGLDPLTGIGGTGVVAVIENGAGPTVLLRADMDGLPVAEETGLDYASTQHAVDTDGSDVAVMHACGHDVHITCLLGATERLLETRGDWSGTLVVLFQPAEERGGGASAMVEDDLYARVPKPDVVLGQHVSPLPAGVIGLHSGAAMAGADSLNITLHGRGGHGSQPETTIDPVVMAASAVVRLQTIVSREVAPSETAALTVGLMRAGTKSNVIAAEAQLGISVRSFSAAVRDRLMAAIERIVRAESQASGATTEPDIELEESFPVTVNDPAATERISAALRAALGAERVLDPGPVTGSEDVGILATAAGVPLVYWFLGGGDPQAFAAAAAAGTIERDIPSNHSPHFAPLIQPTLATGVRALEAAAREWLAGA